MATDEVGRVAWNDWPPAVTWNVEDSEEASVRAECTGSSVNAPPLAAAETVATVVASTPTASTPVTLPNRRRNSRHPSTQVTNTAASSYHLTGDHGEEVQFWVAMATDAEAHQGEGRIFSGVKVMQLVRVNRARPSSDSVSCVGDPCEQMIPSGSEHWLSCVIPLRSVGAADNPVAKFADLVIPPAVHSR